MNCKTVTFDVDVELPRVPRRMTICSGCGGELSQTVFYCDICQDVYCRDCVILINLGEAVWVCNACFGTDAL
eukprot:12425347-Karenia_brevis.AAC.1